MPSDTDLPTLKARLRELHANGNLGELCVVRCDHEEHDVSWVVQTEFGETVARILESEDACARHAADLIAETLNALPTLLDELDRAESESALCLRAACPIDHPGTACQQDCPEHCREGAFELNVGDDLEPPEPGECRYCGMAVQHKLQCPGWPGQRVEPGHAEEHGFTPGELKTGGDAPVPTPARPAPWPLGDDDV